MNKRTLYTVAILAGLVIIALGIWFITSSHSSPPTQTTGGFFGIGGNVSTAGTNGTGGNGSSATSGNSFDRVFRIASGPVASATFVQSSNPTTTLARYVMQDNGHVLDVAIDVPGAAARPVSNTTIPGIQTALWETGGNAALLQYIEGGVVKTVYIGLPSATTTATTASQSLNHIQFLPNGIISIAPSPDGTGIAYLMKSSTGADGYIANADGTAPKKMFSLPLSQMTLVWPSQATLMAESNSSAGIPSILFSITAKTGAVSQLLYGLGLSAIADNTFSKVMYQSVSSGQSTNVSYIHEVTSGANAVVSFKPLPEKCIWGYNPETLYCAVPSGSTDSTYMDLWRQGQINGADTIFAYTIPDLIPEPIMTLGSNNSAPQEPIDSMSVSPDGNYLYFITRGDHSLWGVRL